MPDKYDPEIQKLVEDIHTDIARMSTSIEEIKRALAEMQMYRPMVAPPGLRDSSLSPITRDAATNPGPFRSGRWPVQDGTFPAGASGITPAPSPTNADSPPGNLRSSVKR
jgi:hypothetical protein